MKAALQYTREHNDDYLGWVKNLCAIPSISGDPNRADDIAEAVRHTRDLLNNFDFQTTIHETDGNPVLTATWHHAAGAPTYLVYGHIDVKPAGDRSLWDSEPFEPTLRDDWLICRGSADDKGPLLAHVRAAAAWLATEKRLPINLTFLIEAEEEIGSPQLVPFLKRHQKDLACQGVLISDTGMFADGWPTLTCGTRGLLAKEIRVFGPNHDLHSGSHGGAVANPANELAKLIAGLHDQNKRITIPGFYDDVFRPSREERDMIASLPFNDQEYAAELGVPKTVGEADYTTPERRTIRPTLDVNGIFGGFQKQGPNTIIPAHATAKISMRLVPNQDAAKLSRIFDETLKARCPDTVRLEIIEHGACDAYAAPFESREVAAARKALSEAFGKDAALIREGGSLPILPTFRELLGADSILIGLASPFCNAHGPNEKVRLPDLHAGAEALVRLYGYLGE